jgi:hypothetical protein
MQFKSALISLANAKRDRLTPNSLEYRIGDVLRCITDYVQKGINVFILNEGRPFDYKGKEVLVDEFVATLLLITNFKALVLPNHGKDNFAFNKIILYSPELICVGTKGLWPLNGELVNYPQGAQNCQSIFEVSFIFNNPSNYNSLCEYIGPKPFKVLAIHDPVEFEGRQKYIEALINYTNKQTDPLVCIGDFNFLPDMGGNEQREFISQHLVNCAPNIGITFKGFPHDTNPETGEPWESSLDGVFANEVMLEMFPNYSVETIDTEHKISDHFIVIATFSN